MGGADVMTGDCDPRDVRVTDFPCTLVSNGDDNPVERDHLSYKLGERLVDLVDVEGGAEHLADAGKRFALARLAFRRAVQLGVSDRSRNLLPDSLGECHVLRRVRVRRHAREVQHADRPSLRQERDPQGRAYARVDDRLVPREARCQRLCLFSLDQEPGVRLHHRAGQ